MGKGSRKKAVNSNIQQREDPLPVNIDRDNSRNRSSCLQAHSFEPQHTERKEGNISTISKRTLRQLGKKESNGIPGGRYARRSKQTVRDSEAVSDEESTTEERSDQDEGSSIEEPAEEATVTEEDSLKLLSVDPACTKWCTTYPKQRQRKKIHQRDKSYY